MKKINIPIHKIIAALVFIGVIIFGLSDYIVELEEKRSWAMITAADMHIVRFFMYGIMGVCLSLFSTDGKKVGFRIKKGSLITGGILAVYCLLVLFSGHIAQNNMMGFSSYPDWLVDICNGIYSSLDPITVLMIKLKLFSGKGTFISAVYNMTYLLTGFFMTHSLFGDKE
ncbi:MAG: hypothetical protein IIW34_08600 [Clostridia bacterium]|nr:hypothetical protein [Clostridia bacterium]MBQ2326675.1 hypothetical protein [Clostridia bacterium]MBQ5814194.1 hypothetical protein [Clostridia bacterium]